MPSDVSASRCASCSSPAATATFRRLPRLPHKALTAYPVGSAGSRCCVGTLWRSRRGSARLPARQRGAGPLRVRGGLPPLLRGVPVAGLAHLDRRRALVAAFRSLLGPTARHPRPTHKMLCVAEPTG